ncbi:hypothetical protein [Cystobacter ferrugineus]|uniref:Lipoprotein n=1 Tax=Cystobacter ferrugineus TaxID=83449 RepID=A0A1L9B0F5_9BACT|nr:hypothetical protein [Cystobacter ferrugineus]OJH35748.1 hypothetical protein BON30_37490 [Cystobacter ferrugineus]
MKTSSPLLLALLTLCACGYREEGTRLHLGLDFRPAKEVRAEGTTREFLNDRGDRIRLHRARVTLSAVEIFACQKSTAWKWLRALSPIGTAEAHSEGSPRKLGTPYVMGLGPADGEALALGTLRPPPDSYCRVHLLFAPADADAEGLGEHPDMEGKTLVLEGERIPAEGGPAVPFHVETSDIINTEVTLGGLTLSPESLEASRTLHLAYDRWLDGVDSVAAGSSATEQILRNLAGSVTVQP